MAMAQPRMTHEHSAPVPQQCFSGTGSTNISEPERWASLIGGGALALYGISRASLGGMLLAASGAALAWRGVTAHDPIYQTFGINTASLSQVQGRGQEIQISVTVDKPIADVYRFWHDFENLPRFMKHLQSVTTLGSGRSHWIANLVPARTVEWDAEVIEDRENELIAWRSLPDAAIQNSGSVRFIQAPGDRGTEVHVTIAYLPPAGSSGAVVAALLSALPAQQIKDDLRRFKEVMEAGEVATIDGQPSGQRLGRP